MGSLNQQGEAREQFPALANSERKIRAVVVDDVPAMLESICRVLEVNDGVEVVARARDGMEAVEAVSELNPDLVVMDVSMPRMGGLEATRVVREHFPDTRIVLMSGEESPELREASRRAGAEGFVFKVAFVREFWPMLRELFCGESLDFIA